MPYTCMSRVITVSKALFWAFQGKLGYDRPSLKILGFYRELGLIGLGFIERSDCTPKTPEFLAPNSMKLGKRGTL